VPSLYIASVILHVLAALLWVGGMLFIGIVAAPVLRAIEPAALRQELFQRLGLRFRSIGWVALALLAVTGTINLHYRGWLSWDGALANPAFWRSGVGHALGGKLLGVGILVILSAVHDFVLGPAAGRATPGSPEALILRRRAALLARANALVAILVIIAAVILARGG
jgi:putative copper export protein